MKYKFLPDACAIASAPEHDRCGKPLYLLRPFSVSMTPRDIIFHRLNNQQITGGTASTAGELVEWMIAMQAQLYAMAKWAIGLRLPHSKQHDIDKAFDAGAILRTHLMRPTWHFVTPADIRWLLALTAPRIHTANGFAYRLLKLDTHFLKKTNDILARALEGGKHLTRTDIKEILEQKGIKAGGMQLGYIMMYAELEAVICSGPRAGKQFTYALLDERVPPASAMSREEALQQFTFRYFRTRGPATVNDFCYWSGLTIKDGKEGIAMLGKRLQTASVDGRDYFYVPHELKKQSATFLMPDYDEYGMSYKDRSLLDTTKKYKGQVTPYSHYLVLDGVIAGTWDKKGEVIVHPFFALDKMQQKKVEAALKKYRAFEK
jgi:hypothetical protein